MEHLNANTLRIVRENAEKNAFMYDHEELSRRISAAMERLALVEVDAWANGNEEKAAFFGTWLGLILVHAENTMESFIVPRDFLGFFGAREFHSWLSAYCFGFVLKDAEKDRAEHLEREDRKAAEEALKASETPEATETETEEEGE